jgi:hypothetical protein
VDAPGTAGRAFSAEVVQVLSVVMWGLSAVAVLTSRNRMGRVAAPAVLAFAPFAVLFGQGYGGEAIFRVFLFSVPWCAYLIANLALRIRRLPRPVALLGCTVLVGGVALVNIQGAHGQLTFDKFTPAEVQTAQYVYTHLPHGAVVLPAEGNFPSNLTANYGDVDVAPENWNTILPHTRASITDDDMNYINTMAAGYDRPVYILLTRSMAAYAHYFGYLPDGLLDNFGSALSRSPEWGVFYRTPDSAVFEYLGSRDPG